MKTKDWFSRFYPLRLLRPNTTLLLAVILWAANTSGQTLTAPPNQSPSQGRSFLSVNSNTVTAGAGGTITLNGGSVSLIRTLLNSSTSNFSALLALGNGASIVANNGVNISVMNNGVSQLATESIILGANALSGGVVTLNGGSITTHGTNVNNRAYGVNAGVGGTVIANDVMIQTAGQDSHGVVAAGGTVNLMNGSVTTNGQSAIGLQANGNAGPSVITALGTKITTTGPIAFGATLDGANASTISLTNVVLNTTGPGASGLAVLGNPPLNTANQFTLDSTVVNTSGDGIVWVAQSNANIDLKNGTTINPGSGTLLTVFPGIGSPTLNLNADGNVILNGNVNALARGNSIVNVNLLNNSVLTGAIQNATNVSIESGSTWNITDTSTVTRNVSVNQGILAFQSAAKFASTGAASVLNVGSYTQGPSGILELGLAGLNGSQYDRIQAAGTATVGGTLNLFGLGDAPFAPSKGNAFAVVFALGGRFSQFSDINDEEFNIHGLQRVNLYLKNAVVVLYLTPHVRPEPEPEPSPQPPGVTPPVPPTEEPPPINEEEDNVSLPPVDPNQPIPESEVVQLVDPTAEELTSLYEISFSAANMQRFNLGDRMFQIQQSVVPPPPVPPIPTPTLEKGAEGKGVEGKAPPPAPLPSPINRWGVWANGWGDFVNVDSTSTAQGYRFTTGGVSAGVDYLIIPNHFAVGLFGGYSHSWINFTPSGSADTDTGRGGLYATYFNQGWWVDAAVWGGGTDYSTSRQALAGTANGSTSGWEFSTFGEAGYDIHCGALAFGPTVAMQFTRVFLNGFSENGSLVPLDIHGAGQNSLRTDVGGRVYYKWLVGNIPVIPTVNLGWEHEYKYSTLDIGASAPALDASTTFSGPNIGHDSLLINAGISVQWTPRIWTTIGYDGDVARDHYNSNAVSGTFSFSF
jgi:uncharacterized protein YhjY with autotransporter beta-barrel domain